MVIDSSALIAILRREPEEQAFRNAIKLASSRLLSASTRVEIGIVALGLAGEVGLKQADALLETLRVETVPLSARPRSGGCGQRRAPTVLSDPRDQAGQLCHRTIDGELLPPGAGAAGIGQRIEASRGR